MAVIGVMGSGKQAWPELAEPLGQWIARAGHHLLTGGGGGVMTSVSRAFHQTPGRPGRCIGILPTRPDAAHGFAPLDGYPNPFVEIPIVTPLPRFDAADGDTGRLTRNHVNILSSDVVIALPGSQGTRDEIGLGLAFGKPVVGFGPADAFELLPRPMPVMQDLDEVIGFVAKALARQQQRPAAP